MVNYILKCKLKGKQIATYIQNGDFLYYVSKATANGKRVKTEQKSLNTLYLTFGSLFNGLLVGFSDISRSLQ